MKQNFKDIFRYFYTLLSILVIAALSFWYFTDLKITKWGNVKLTTSNFLESYYWTKRNIFWSKSLNSIEQKIKDPSLKVFLLEKYTNTIPVHQWWSPLRVYKQKALETLLLLYEKEENWKKIETNALEFINLNPNYANGWYYLGLSLEKQNKIDEAIKNYQKALLVEITHLNSIKKLSSILLVRGEYYQINELLLPYDQIIEKTNQSNLPIDRELERLYQEINEKTL
jgi:tetratricopeptide (TPR) repeat protein